MSSPFSTIDEFQGAIDGPTEGAIYTFAGSPAVNTVALLIGIGIFFWFLAKTFSTRYEANAVDKSLNHLSAFIVAGLLSLAGAEYRQTYQPHLPTEAPPQAVSPRPGAITALGLLGMVGIGLPARQRWSKTGPKKPVRRKGLYRDIGSSR
jgi:hypothetical protein